MNEKISSVEILNSEITKENIEAKKSILDIDKALEILTAMSMDKNERTAYLSRKMALHDQATFIEEGREEGEIEAKIETAKNLLSMKIDVEIIAQGTGLSINEIKKIKEEI